MWRSANGYFRFPLSAERVSAFWSGYVHCMELASNFFFVTIIIELAGKDMWKELQKARDNRERLEQLRQTAIKQARFKAAVIARKSDGGKPSIPLKSKRIIACGQEI